MTKKQINQNKQEKIEFIIASLEQAIEKRDHYVPKKDLEKMVKKNFEKMRSWMYSDFSFFASELCTNWGNFEETKKQFELK
jgi:protein associated with RNAse G/E